MEEYLRERTVFVLSLWTLGELGVSKASGLGIERIFGKACWRMKEQDRKES